MIVSSKLIFIFRVEILYPFLYFMHVSPVNVCLFTAIFIKKITLNYESITSLHEIFLSTEFPI